MFEDHRNAAVCVRTECRHKLRVASAEFRRDDVVDRDESTAAGTHFCLSVRRSFRNPDFHYPRYWSAVEPLDIQCQTEEDYVEFAPQFGKQLANANVAPSSQMR